MIELTKHQEAVLTRLANSRTGHGKYAAHTSVPADGKVGEEIDQIFAQDVQLLEWGLVYDVTTLPCHKKFVKQMKQQEGRNIVILAPTELAKLMFARGVHGHA